MKSATRLMPLVALALVACQAPAATPTAPPPTKPAPASPAASPAASPVAAASPAASPLAKPEATKPTVPAPVLSPSPARSPVASPAAVSKTGLPEVHATSSVPRDPGFMSEVWIDFEFATPITSEVELQRVVNGMVDLTGVAEAKSDGAHISVMYDTARVQGPRMRERLEELGHPASEGSEVPAPGDTSD